MSRPARQLTRALFCLLTILVVVGQTGGGVNAARFEDCSQTHIFCGGEQLDIDDTDGPWGWPGVYIDSGQGTTRFGLYCSAGFLDHDDCHLYVYRFDNGWDYVWSLPSSQTVRARHVFMHGSGNLHIYDKDWNLVWESGTTMGETNAYLNVHDNGCASIWHEDDSGTVWSTCS